ncbi:NAD+ kinase [Methanosarcina thermophila]|uniref:NAD kinase n=3 Tax=Methanosarcina thermophila TaxID=2210 RepID=A0A1I7ACH7_METTE|nr:NAD(+)/NADH kinase [Methanosarcina thermophila]ALK06222.1 MAG: inorganic polyphosphate kinase [Methanosarcina sp. 795]AKB12189.1 NAD kinase [Methanosarcina thermophila TM-1]AKB14608.1 NAD kinase [Methanosarcina thermophila CHTI-55]NLU57787.1 NAD(+)/NADH kinase [Methanosarcina thermophila]SFT72593.1 NAD+ kinase [Methanosarcina thermophila]
MAIKKIGIASRCDRPEVIRMVREILARFSSRVKIYVATPTAEVLGIEGTPVEKMREEGVELIISVGGDGTVLRNIAKMKDPLPILGINMGTLGFLVDVEPEDALETIEEVLYGFSYIERMRVDVFLNGELLDTATNEIAIMSAKPAKIIQFEVYVGDCLLDSMRADGVVFATPTGSTAYAMSAGGPIISPRVNAIVVVPVAPFKLSSRPWVIPSDSEITIKLSAPKKEAVIAIDGQKSYRIKPDDIVKLKKSKFPARFVKISDTCFYERVQRKLA